MDEEKKKILIIEDDLDALKLYSEILKRDYEILTAEEGIKGLEIISPQIDLILLDRMLPNMRGEQVLNELRSNENPEISNIPVILLTALDADIDVIDLDFDSYLTKPISPEELRREIKEVISVNKYETGLDEYFSLINKKNALIESLGEENLRNNQKFIELSEEISSLEEELNENLIEVLKDIPPSETERFEKILRKILGDN